MDIQELINKLEELKEVYGNIKVHIPDVFSTILSDTIRVEIINKQEVAVIR